MAYDLIFRVGETKRIQHVVDSGETGVTVSSATITIYNSAGTATVSAAACTIDPVGADTEHSVYYAWNTAAVDPGDYHYILKYTVGAETEAIEGAVYVVPATSKFDRYVDRVRRWLVLSVGAPDAEELSWVDARDAVKAAVIAYSGARPYRKQATQAMTSNVWEYALPSDWVNEFSVIEKLEYPVDATEQIRFFDDYEWAVDELRGKWYWVAFTPTTGETARLYYTTLHEVRDAYGSGDSAVEALDTVPAQHFEALTKYAAGEALLMLASKASHTVDETTGADVVSYRDKQLRYKQQAETYKEEAAAAWSKRKSLSVRGIAM